MRASALGLFVFVALSCTCSLSCSDKTDGTVTIVTGDETDTFSRTPSPTTLLVEKVDQSGNKTTLTRTHLPADTVDLGNLQQADVGAIAVSGLDDSGKVLVHGETLLVQWGALSNTTFEVFAQRTGELARMPLGPSALDATNVTVIVGRYILTTNATTTASLYDLLTLSTADSLPAIPQPVKSIAAIGTTALLIDENGATTLDLDLGSTAAISAPAGGNFGEIAGGSTIAATDTTQYVVGATRGSGGATPRVLRVGTDGTTAFLALATPREAGCATWVDGRGLVVVGGAATGSGVEIFGPGATSATPLPFPANPVRGCGATTLDSTHVLVVGGTDPAGKAEPAHVLDLTCNTACVPAAWPDTIPLVRAQAATLAPDAAFVVGDDAAGASHAFRVAATGGLHEIALKIPRRGARMVATPASAFAVVGGGAAGIEQYIE